MATAVFFHAHPDDEAIATGGTMAKAAAAGHRVVLVFATKGEHGEVEDGFLDPGEELWQRRMQEAEASGKVLGAQRVEFLGYTDSGMVDTPENNAPESFWQADVDEAAQKLARILEEEQADVLTIYDPNGNYGHPDHIQVHRVGARAGELAKTPKVYEATIDRDYIRALIAQAAEMGLSPAGDGSPPPDPEEFNMGMPGELITTRVDVRDHLGEKRQAMRAHASQISETSFFLAMPEPAFEAAWGIEFYILRGVPKETEETDLFEGVG
ncbi:MAG TPA: PIG-L family deacetylase [Acidimicrobiales bacterium]|nr:PIG-L family deacetylase [Acidimicrobiales bacterium]